MEEVTILLSKIAPFPIPYFTTLDPFSLNLLLPLRDFI